MSSSKPWASMLSSVSRHHKLSWVYLMLGGRRGDLALGGGWSKKRRERTMWSTMIEVVTWLSSGLCELASVEGRSRCHWWFRIHDRRVLRDVIHTEKPESRGKKARRPVRSKVSVPVLSFGRSTAHYFYQIAPITRHFKDLSTYKWTLQFGVS